MTSHSEPTDAALPRSRQLCFCLPPGLRARCDTATFQGGSDRTGRRISRHHIHWALIHLRARRTEIWQPLSSAALQLPLNASKMQRTSADWCKFDANYVRSPVIADDCPLVSVLNSMIGSNYKGGLVGQRVWPLVSKGTANGSMRCAAKQSVRGPSSTLNKWTLQKRQCRINGAHAKFNIFANRPVCHKCNANLPGF